MNEKHTYSGDRTKNHFTAYLLEFIKGRRSSYLDKKIRTEKNSFLMEEIAEIEERITIEEIQESQRREQLLLKESEGSFPDWSALADQKLVKSLLMLSEEEKDLIYLHVFEERSFDDMSRITGLTSDRCKNIYYYAIRKIRKRMGAKRDEF